jgi:hypothetical protein
MRAQFRASEQRFEVQALVGAKTTLGSEKSSAPLSHEAGWALKRLAQQRYGLDAPVLSGSVTSELIQVVFVPMPQQGGMWFRSHPARPPFSAGESGQLMQVGWLCGNSIRGAVDRKG